MKKKLLLLSAIATFAFALCGCDSEEKKDSDDKTTTEATTEEATEASDVSVKAQDAVRGEVKDGVFTNDVFKVSFPIQDDWYVCSDSEIAQLIGIASDSLQDGGDMTAEDFEAATAGTIYDIVFYFSDMQTNGNITYVNLSGLGPYAALPVDDYAELTITQLEAMTTTVYTIGDTTHETYGGDEYTCINAETNQGFNQKMLLKKENGYMVCITLTFFPEVESEIQAFLDSMTEVQ